jgi:hypothetical protein
MVHDIIDIFAFIVGILGLIPLWREQGRKFLAILFSCLILVGSCYIVWNYYQARQEEKDQAQDLANKEEQVISMLCLGGANYEEIYARTSFGYPNKILDDAIDDLMQYKHAVKIEDVNLKYSGPPPRGITVRIFQIASRDFCPAAGH